MWLHPEIRALHQIPHYWATRSADKIAIRAGDISLTYGQLEEQVALLACALAALGEPGSQRPVGFVGKNMPEVWTAWFGAGRCGRPFVPFNWRSPAPELAEVVQDAAPEVIFAEREHADTVAQAVATTGAPIHVVVFDSLASGGSGLSGWVSERPAATPSPATGQDVALLAYTSGTTGRPKGAQVLNEAFSLSVLSDELEPTITWSTDDVMLMVMPNFHLAGTWVSVPALYYGATVAIVPAFEPAAVLAAIETYRPTVACLVPTAIQFLVHSEAAQTTDFSSLHTLVYAGSPMPATTIDKALEVLDCDLRQFYGTTETYIISILRPDDHRVTDPEAVGIKASCGKPVPLVETRVVSPDGADVATGEVGEVLVRSPYTMAGYLGKPQETADAIRDSWYWTGDLGYRDAGGFLYLVDRAKDMVVTGGENVYSVEVERALQRHPKVAMVAVVGTADDRWGEAVTAYVVPSAEAQGDDGDALADELAAHAHELIAGYKVPKIIRVVESLPMTSSGKIRKVDLRKQGRPVPQS